MQVGSIVVCNTDLSNHRLLVLFQAHGIPIKIPVKGKEYTVREIKTSTDDSTTICILLEELDNSHIIKLGAADETGFNITYFSELLPPIEINLEEILEESMEQKMAVADIFLYFAILSSVNHG